ncbi:tail fiber protein [Klebsiella phage Pylas]|uniref:Tail fiber protein n=1 Tax=Klebsiella phage Pylas TaxID=2419682 RepID=A0A3G3BYQ7_9CAUD|nr:tail fiber protein [Klebsiella phage Pylas]AYP69336.1 tail fiber protein [Klebsiella phage Pylas]
MSTPPVNSCNSSAGLIEKYINSAYDNVKAVADNLDYLDQIYQFLLQYGLITNIAVKAPVQAVAASPITLSGNQVLTWSAHSGDYSVLATTGMRVLVLGQTNPVENGIYDVQNNAWTRSVDFDGPKDVVDGTLVFSSQGDVWQVDGPQYSLVPGTDPIIFKDIDLFAYEALKEATEKAQEAAASAAAAAASENAAKTSEMNSKDSELAAEAARDQIQQIINDAAEQSTLAVLAQPSGGSQIGLEQGLTVQQAISWTMPQAFGATGDGVHDDTQALYDAFKSTYETVFIPKGTYHITRKLKCLLTKNLRVICAPGVVFKLADNARCNMMVFVSDRKHDFEWFGGEFDGNWAGQGDETLNSNGTFKDLSHGFIVSLFNNVRLDNMYVHSFRGHSMNHAGNKKLHASNLRFNSHIAQAFPQGGSRGDGITGCSEDVLIENVYGFTTDDMVAVFAGILWVEGGTEADSAMVTNLDYLTCKSVTIRNVNPWHKTSDIDPNTTVYTWNGVVVGGQGGIGVEKVHISNVKGYTQYSGVRVGASDPVGSAPATDYWNTMGSVIIDDISVRVAGASTNQHLYNSIRIGSLTAASTGDAHTCLINSLVLSNIQLWPTGNNRTLIGIGYTTIYNLDINSISIRGNYADDTYYAIHCAGDRQIAQVSINGVTHNPPSTSSDTIAQAQLILYWAVTYSNTAAKISFSGVPARRSSDGSSYLPNLFIANGSVAPYVYGFDAVIRASNNFHSLPRVKGIYCTDRYLGRVRVSPNTGLWEFLDYATTYESSTFGKPSASTFSNYGLITWLPGMVVKCVGSPNESIDSWVYNSNGDWQMQGKTVTNNMVSLITVSSTPSIIAPYAMMTSPVYNDATWPESYGVVALYGGHQNLRAGAYEDFVSTTGNTYRRTWNTNTSAWNSWYRLPRVVDVPASATASGVAGNIAISSTYLYVCVATNTWVRAAVSTW